MASRKRNAPGASPLAQRNTYAESGTMANDSFMNNWTDPTSTGGDIGGFGDASFYDGMNYAGGVGGQPSTHNRVISLDGLNENSVSGGGQLVRRNTNQQLAARGRSPWDAFNNNSQQPSTWENTDDDEELERKAVIAKKDAQAKRKQIPPFVQKLSSFLDNGNNTNLIRWSDDGNSFIVLDEDEFARTLIPELFKHNNYASFVRQLNMYGFHKKVGLSDNSMKASEAKSKAPSEYYNKYFKRGRPELLWLIQKPKNVPAGPKRKREDDAKQGDSDEERKFAPDGGGGNYADDLTLRGTEDMAMIPRTEYNSLRAEVRTLQQQQKVISNVLSQIRRQNDQLYQQATAFQTLHDRHENSINAILTFLATFYNRTLEGNNNNINISDMFGPAMAAQPQQGSVVDVGDYTEAPLSKSPHLAKKNRAIALLPAPPIKDMDSASPRAKTASPTVQSAAVTPLPTPGVSSDTPAQNPFNSRGTAHSGGNAKPQPLKVETEPPTPSALPIPENEEIMSAIQSANANTAQFSQASPIDLPAALNSYQHQNGQTPLTPQQRNDVLALMANNTSAASPNGALATSTNNALLNPQPPPMPALDQFAETQQQLDLLQKMSEEQNSRVQSLQERLQPLSPSGPITGLSENYFDSAAMGEPGNFDDLDINNFVEGDDFFPDTGMTSLDPDMPDLNYQLLNAGSGVDNSAAEGFINFNADDDHLGVADMNNRVESVSSSATSPAATVEEVEDESRQRNSKRRRT